ncbi:MAG: major capsid protein [Desulfovibrio sp.]
MFIQLQGLFAPQAIADHLRTLPKLKTTIMDVCFPERKQKPFALLGLSEIMDIIGTVPVIRRGGASVPLDNGNVNITFIEPLPVKPSKTVAGQDLNNLKLIISDKGAMNAWVKDYIDMLRQTCRATTEAIAAQALTGKISWPVKLEGGGWDTYEIDFGATHTRNPAKMLDADGASIMDLYNLLSEMETSIQESGHGGEIAFMAGKKAYTTILKLIEASKTTAKLKVGMEKGKLIVGEYTIVKMAETYRHPKTKAMVPKVPTDHIVGFATDVTAAVFYCALDDLDAKLQPLPFFPKVIKTPEGDGLKVIGQSKPLPVRNPKSICWSKVLNAA